jgi:Tfp pilus assembly protein PilP
MIKTLSLIVIGMFMASSLGCGKAAPPAQKKAVGEAQKAGKEEPKKEEKKEEALPALPADKKPEFEAYVYDAKGKRDPFVSLIEISKKEKEAEKKKKGLTPSESFDVADINVIAIAWEKDRYYAMVQLPDKKYFTVKEGTALGIYGGRVIRIDKGSVLVREYVKDYKGEVQPKDTILKLRKEEVE